MFDELTHLPPVFRITVSYWQQGRSRNQAGKNLKQCQVINYVARTHPRLQKLMMFRMQELSVDKIRTDEEVRSNVLTGRRLAFGDAVMEQKETKNSESRTSSGAKYSVGKCSHGGGKDLSMSCNFRSRKPPPKVYFDGHIPFTADYRSPRKHPPKNN